jgi:hypothetical protein
VLELDDELSALVELLDRDETLDVLLLVELDLLELDELLLLELDDTEDVELLDELDSDELDELDTELEDDSSSIAMIRKSPDGNETDVATLKFRTDGLPATPAAYLAQTA